VPSGTKKARERAIGNRSDAGEARGREEEGGKRRKEGREARERSEAREEGQKD
jgi:hypothetical protein